MGSTQIRPNTLFFGEMKFTPFLLDVEAKQLMGRLRAMHYQKKVPLIIFGFGKIVGSDQVAKVAQGPKKEHLKKFICENFFEDLAK